MNEINFDALERKAQAFAASGMFGKMSKDEALSRLILAHDLGLGDVSAMRDIYHANDGNIAIRGPAYAAKVSSHPNYTFDMTESTRERCTITLTRRSDGQSWTSTLTIEQAEQEGFSNTEAWTANPDAMLYYRLLSKMVRWYAGDIWNNNTIYSSADFTETQNVAPEKPIDIDNLPIPEPEQVSLEELDEPEETTEPVEEETTETEENTVPETAETNTVSAKDAPF